MVSDCEAASLAERDIPHGAEPGVAVHERKLRTGDFQHVAVEGGVVCGELGAPVAYEPQAACFRAVPQLTVEDDIGEVGRPAA